MRGLRDLEPDVQSPAAKSRSAWGDRQRVGFLFALGSLTCLLVAGYLWAGLPELPERLSDDLSTQIIDELSPSDRMMVHKQAEQASLGAANTPFEAMHKVRQTMTWGIGIVLGLALLAAASACFVVWIPAKTK